MLNRVIFVYFLLLKLEQSRGPPSNMSRWECTSKSQGHLALCGPCGAAMRRNDASAIALLYISVGLRSRICVDDKDFECDATSLAKW